MSKNFPRTQAIDELWNIWRPYGLRNINFFVSGNFQRSVNLDGSVAAQYAFKDLRIWLIKPNFVSNLHISGTVYVHLSYDSHNHYKPSFNRLKLATRRGKPRKTLTMNSQPVVNILVGRKLHYFPQVHTGMKSLLRLFMQMVAKRSDRKPFLRPECLKFNTKSNKNQSKQFTLCLFTCKNSKKLVAISIFAVNPLT